MNEITGKIADYLAIFTFFITITNLWIIKSIRRNQFEKKYYPKRIHELQECNKFLIMQIPQVEYDIENIRDKIVATNLVLLEILKQNTILNKLRILKIYIHGFYIQIRIFNLKFNIKKNIRRFHLKIDTYIYIYERQIERKRIGGQING